MPTPCYLITVIAGFCHSGYFVSSQAVWVGRHDTSWSSTRALHHMQCDPQQYVASSLNSMQLFKSERNNFPFCCTFWQGFQGCFYLFREEWDSGTSSRDGTWQLCVPSWVSDDEKYGCGYCFQLLWKSWGKNLCITWSGNSWYLCPHYFKHAQKISASELCSFL